MSDTLLPYYESELAAIRELAADFARAHPRVAEGLRLSPDSVADPHVERLLEGVAFLAARVQHRLDDELPELTDALLDLLSPSLLAPLPSEVKTESSKTYRSFICFSSSSAQVREASVNGTSGGGADL